MSLIFKFQVFFPKIEPASFVSTEVESLTDKLPIIGEKRKHIENSQLKNKRCKEKLTDYDDQVIYVKSNIS